MLKLLDKYFTWSAIYSFFTNKLVRIIVMLVVFTVIDYSYYKFYYDQHANGDITLKYEIDTENLSVEEIKDYLEKNKFSFYGGNPLEFTNFNLLDDGVAFRRYVDNNQHVGYQYCNNYLFSRCIDTDVEISQLSKTYKEGSDFYNRAVNIYNDYYKKLEQLKLIEEQVRSVLDYYYEQIS